MLNIFNELAPFIEDSQAEIHVREYAKLTGLSAPTAAKRLAEYEHEGILSKRIDKRHHLYMASHTGIYQDICQAYWRQKLSPLTQQIESVIPKPIIVLFGSLAKGNASKTSDIDIVIFGLSSKVPETSHFEKKFKRTIHLFSATRKEDITNPHLLTNMREGIYLAGSWSDVEFLSGAQNSKARAT